MFGYVVVIGDTSSCRNGRSSVEPLSLNVTAAAGLPVTAGAGVPLLVFVDAGDDVPPQATTASAPNSAIPPIKPVRIDHLSSVVRMLVAGGNLRNND